MSVTAEKSIKPHLYMEQIINRLNEHTLNLTKSGGNFKQTLIALISILSFYSLQTSNIIFGNGQDVAIIHAKLLNFVRENNIDIFLLNETYLSNHRSFKLPNFISYYSYFLLNRCSRTFCRNLSLYLSIGASFTTLSIFP